MPRWLREHDTMAESGQLERVADVSKREIAIAERVGEPAMRYRAAYDAEACVALVRGDPAAAEHGAVRALQIGTDAGQPDAQMIFSAGWIASCTS
jgi:hypothetical protein